MWKLVLAVLFCLGIFLGTLEQARILMRRQQKKTDTLSQAKRNTLLGDLDSLALGIKQVQRYIDSLKNHADSRAVAAAITAQTWLDKAKKQHAETVTALPAAATETELRICETKIGLAQSEVGRARSFVQDFLDDDGNPVKLRLSLPQVSEAALAIDEIACLKQVLTLRKALEERQIQLSALALAENADKKQIMILTEQLRITESFVEELMRFVMAPYVGRNHYFHVPTRDQAVWAYTAAKLSLNFVDQRIKSLQSNS